MGPPLYMQSVVDWKLLCSAYLCIKTDNSYTET